MLYLFDSTRISSEISWLFVMIMILILLFFWGGGGIQVKIRIYGKNLGELLKKQEVSKWPREKGNIIRPVRGVTETDQ